jgi:beta-lactamase regulating signal transducer with metallopeptidase domain
MSSQTVFDGLRHSNAAALIFDTALQSFVVLAVAGGVCLCLRRASAATRHLIWFLSVACLPLLPLFASLPPAWQKPLWSVSAGSGAGNQFSVALEFAPVAPATTPVNRVPLPNATAGATRPVGAPSASHGKLAAQFSANWIVPAFFVWSGGSLLALGSILAAQWRVRRIERRSQVLRDADWTELLRELRGQLRIRRPVTLLQGAEDVMPGTWGTRRPTVLLPMEAGQWPPERRRVVLQHELAHVRRWDCWTQMITGIVCAFFWFNPLVWLAARRMCVERERACDDVVLNIGCKASDYAGHLVDIARSFRPLPQTAAIAMARACPLERRVAAIVDASRARRMRPMTVAAVAGLLGGMILAAGGCISHTTSLRDQQITRMEEFSRAKEAQAQELAAKAGEKISPEYQRFFDAAIKGDWTTVNKMFDSFRKRHPQYEHKASQNDLSLRTSYWGTVLEICLAYDIVAKCEPAYTQMAVDDMLHSIPAGSIYFGGTDPGRGLPTAFCKSHAEADPFFTLTQNALADSTYLDYLRAMYGRKIHTPTKEDLQKCFGDYLEDATRRLRENKLKPDENIRIDNGKTNVSGQVAVMSINALLAKIIFDKNPEREFYIEESFPLDWMYPYLEPHGLIMKINRQPLTDMPEEIVQKDREYWNSRVAVMIGDWLADDTPVQTVADFVDRVYVRGDLGGFNGDRKFIQNDYAKRMFSKWRSDIAGIHAWRANNSKSADEQKRMLKEADFAYRQAWALCPYSPEAVFQYVELLMSRQRKSDALLIAETTVRVAPPDENGSGKAQLDDLIKTLKARQSAQ